MIKLAPTSIKQGFTETLNDESFRFIFESVTVGVKLLAENGDILKTNPAFREMIGYEESEVVGRKFHEFLHPQDMQLAIRLFRDVKVKDINHFRFEHRAIHKDQSVIWVNTIFSIIKSAVADDGPGLIVGIVENVTEQKRLEAEMEELNSRLQNSMELERLRLAQELHDGPMQSVHSSIYRIEEMRSRAGASLEDDLAFVTNTLRGVLKNLRATAKELRPPTIFDFGLENAIRSHMNDIAEEHPRLHIHLSLAHDRQMLPEKIRLALFRVFQQAVANVLQHAEATSMQVQFSFDAEETHLEITDNGKGFEVPPNWVEFVRHEHYGLAGASERVAVLGGVLSVESRPGSSTTVRVTIPLTDASEQTMQTVGRRGEAA